MPLARARKCFSRALHRELKDTTQGTDRESWRGRCRAFCFLFSGIEARRSVPKLESGVTQGRALQVYKAHSSIDSPSLRGAISVVPLRPFCGARAASSQGLCCADVGTMPHSIPPHPRDGGKGLEKGLLGCPRPSPKSTRGPVLDNETEPVFEHALLTAFAPAHGLLLPTAADSCNGCGGGQQRPAVSSSVRHRLLRLQHIDKPNTVAPTALSRKQTAALRSNRLVPVEC